MFQDVPLGRNRGDSCSTDAERSKPIGFNVALNSVCSVGLLGQKMETKAIFSHIHMMFLLKEGTVPHNKFIEHTCRFGRSLARFYIHILGSKQVKLF